MDQDETPRINDDVFVNFAVFPNNLKLNDIPAIIEHFARAFENAPTRSPLRMRIASKATADVVAPDCNPKSSIESTIGIPVKSNFNIGSKGKGIFRPEHFIHAVILQLTTIK